MKKIFLCILCFLFFSSHAQEEMKQKTFLDINPLPESNYIEKELTLSAENITEFLWEEKGINPTNISYTWNIDGEEKQGEKITHRFYSSGVKKIQVRVSSGEEELFFQESNIFIYSHTIPTLIFKKNETLLADAKNAGVYLYELDGEKFYQSYQQYQKNVIGKTVNFLLIIGEYKNAFTTLNTIHELGDDTFEILISHFILVSDGYISKFPGIFQNFLTGKGWIQMFLIVPHKSSIPILQGGNIESIYETLETGGYQYIDIDNASQKKLPKWKIISSFVNTTANAGFTARGIYFILIIPFLITLVVLFKHFIGIGPIGILLPVFLTLMSLKDGFLSVFLIFLIFFLINIIIHYIFSRYVMLHIPKIAMIFTINIVLMLFIIPIISWMGITDLNPDNVLYYIVFIFLMERVISMIWSKPFREYKNSFINTLIFTFVGYIIFIQSVIESFILGYPEFIILLIFVNAFFSQYAGLRLTEYFRFSEVLNVSEEE